tara:strand:- start:263 stop:457 length:195 start_codon:yes stop_codon:yes gene_type:complete
MIPKPVLELSLEQQLKMRTLTDALEIAEIEDVRLLADSLQRQVFLLQNTMVKLIKTGHWDEADC